MDSEIFTLMINVERVSIVSNQHRSRILYCISDRKSNEIFLRHGESSSERYYRLMFVTPRLLIKQYGPTPIS